MSGYAIFDCRDYARLTGGILVAILLACTRWLGGKLAQLACYNHAHEPP